jgi:hypothetical protein
MNCKYKKTLKIVVMFTCVVDSFSVFQIKNVVTVS